MTTLQEIVALDLLTLRAHTERAGDILDADLHPVRVRGMLERCKVCLVRKATILVAYAALAPESQTCWFVQAFNTHPSHRTPAVLSALLARSPSRPTGKASSHAAEETVRRQGMPPIAKCRRPPDHHASVGPGCRRAPRIAAHGRRNGPLRRGVRRDIGGASGMDTTLRSGEVTYRDNSVPGPTGRATKRSVDNASERMLVVR
ncbi:hypothetical protein OVY01_05675 [Robbsia sp. Bb-Pol-6]|uniref:Transposase n=1 Tax=Robbsia betulipollinis TaxID=2981849 RepID=A0ABT3ZLB1_9BURK|nr:hypothetical protein [Robbsia betulipollinis]MCY0386733.1 hypothetical protein [Robbsia betulipollinis]